MLPQIRVLVIESSGHVADLLLRYLRTIAISGVDHAPDGETGLSMVESIDYPLITLDTMTPKLGGPALCRSLREVRPESSILAVTARSDALAPLLGMRFGIDDYVYKPVAPTELIRKAEALLPRLKEAVSQGDALADLVVGGVSLYPSSRSLGVNGKAVANLSVAEFDLLYFLARHPETAFSEDEILAKLWGLGPPIRLKHLSVDLRLLRMKLKHPSSGFRYLQLTKAGMRLISEAGIGDGTTEW